MKTDNGNTNNNNGKDEDDSINEFSTDKKILLITKI